MHTDTHMYYSQTCPCMQCNTRAIVHANGKISFLFRIQQIILFVLRIQQIITTEKFRTSPAALRWRWEIAPFVGVPQSSALAQQPTIHPPSSPPPRKHQDSSTSTSPATMRGME